MGVWAAIVVIAAIRCARTVHASQSNTAPIGGAAGFAKKVGLRLEYAIKCRAVKRAHRARIAFVVAHGIAEEGDFIHTHATARRRHAWIRRPAIGFFAFGSKTLKRAALAKACIKPIGGALGGEIGIGALGFVIEASRASRHGQASGDFSAALRGRAFPAASSNRALARRSDARARCARAYGTCAHGVRARREIAAEFGDLIATVAAFFHGIAVHRYNGRAALLKKAERILAVWTFGNGEAFLNADDLARAAR